MSILYGSIELAASFVEIFIMYGIYDTLLHKHRIRQSRRIDFTLAAAGAVMIQLCNYISLFSYFTILIAVLYYSISAAFLYKVKYITLFSISSFYLLCLSSFDFLVVTGISSFYGGYETFVTLISKMGIARTVMILVIKILWILGYILYKKCLYRFFVKWYSSYTILAVSCAGFVGFVSLVNQTFRSLDFSIAGVWFDFFILLALILFVSYFVIETREEKMKLNFAEMRNQMLEENYKAINDIYMSNAKLYHDLNNHLNVLYQLLEQENNNEAKKYIQEISKPILKLSQIAWTGVDVVDVIINSKIEKMKEKEIAYEINVEFPQNTNILAHDMCTILANLLDNAIEAVNKVEYSRRILLTI